MDNEYLASTPPGPGDYDGDGPPAIQLMRGDYTSQFRTVVWGGAFVDVDGHKIPTFATNTNGKAFIAQVRNGDIASTEWARAVERALNPTGLPLSATINDSVTGTGNN